MNKGTAVLGVILAFVGGYFLGHYTTKGSKKSGDTVIQGEADKGAEAAAPVAGGGPGGPSAPQAAAAGEERYKLDVGDSPVRGPKDALVTIVEFSDFQCPFCSRAEDTMKQIRETYGEKVRIVYKQNPLPFHPNAKPAAKASLAAMEQGKFWEMHDKMFAQQDALGTDQYVKWAGEIGIDVNKFKADMDAAKFDSVIDGDMKAAESVGARGTPTFFVNGILVRGAQPFDAFKPVIDKELAHAQEVLGRGVSKDQLYAEITKDGRTTPAPAAAPAAQPGQPDPAKTYHVELGNAPVKGKADALVTIIEWSDFQCPFCSRVGATVKQIEETYGDKVRIAFKMMPLPMHPNAPMAAQAGLAAAEQGKFWEMHDAMFADQEGLDRAGLEAKAQKIGLDMNKFKAALDSGKFKAQIDQDQAQGGKFGIRGTPSFYINGRPLRGAQPFDSFKAVIDDELKKAEALKSSGVAANQVYDKTIANGLTEVAAAPAAPAAPSGPQPGEPDEGKTYNVQIGANSPMKGAKSAKVTIIEWSDFQCPFCSRVEPSLKQITDKYGDDVRIVWRNYPLPFHPNAMPSAKAALAAGKQGKFWEFHDKLFANQQQEDQATFEKYAQELGLNVAKFKADMNDPSLDTAIKADMDYGQKFGVNGTPSFYVNGRFIGGAVPFEAFDAKIKEVLGQASGKTYEQIVGSGLTEVAAAAPQPAGAAPGAPPPPDTTIFKVDAGDAPAKGPVSAPVQIVEFSDFQCPFCGRVVPTVHQIIETYGNKVRLSFKDMPLPFHEHAALAAEAAMAANAQGKFWQMHDKMFGNQEHLTEDDLNKYAADIGLDVAKFKADLASHKWKAKVDADVAQANALGGLGTPTFFINGHKIPGAMPFESFKQVIDAELAKH